jgi:hypothetical protein
MPQTVIVLRPFVFTFAPIHGHQKLATELKITPERDPLTKEWKPTERELSDDILAHPWISEHFADGCIERPEKTKERMEAAQAKKDAEIKASAKIVADAEAALARASRGTQIKQGREADVQRDLNTPINQLRSRQGDDIDQPIGPAKEPQKARKTG